MDNYILTSEGYRSKQNINRNMYVMCPNMGLVSNVNLYKHKTVNSNMFSVLSTSLYTLPVLVHNEDKVLAIQDTNGVRSVAYKNLNCDDWIRFDWTVPTRDNTKTIIDLASSDLTYNFKNIYVSDCSNEIKNLAQEVDIPIHGLRNLLIFEDANYVSYIPELLKYIPSYFPQSPYIPSQSEENIFKDFKSYMIRNHIKSYPRYVSIDKQYLAFVLLTLNCCSYTSSESYSFVINTTMYKDLLPLFKQFVSRFQFNNTNKFESVSQQECLYVVDSSNPILLSHIKSLYNSIDFILHTTDENKQFFLDNLFSHKESTIYCSLNVALQIKELMLSHRRLLYIIDTTRGVVVQEAFDNFDSLESDIIIEQDYYYTRIVAMYPYTQTDCVFDYIDMKHSVESLITVAGVVTPS